MSPGDETYPYVPLPTDILLDERVSDPAKILWALLYQVSTTGGGDMFEMSFEELAQLSRSSKPSVAKRRDELVAAGWLEVVVLPGLARKQQFSVKTPDQQSPARTKNP